MYHVRLKWLTWFQISQALFATVIVVAYILHVTVSPNSNLIAALGISIPAFVGAVTSVAYSLFIYPVIRSKIIWWAHGIGIMLSIITMEIIIEQTGGYSSWVWVPWITLTGFTAMLGPFLPMLIVATNLALFALVLTGTIADSSPIMGVYVIGIEAIVVALSCFLFRHQYVQTSHESNRIQRLDSLLKEEQVKSEILIASIADGVVVVDREGTIQLFNPAASAMTGWHSEEAIGIDNRSIFSFYDDQDHNVSETLQPFASVLEQGTQFANNDLKLGTRSSKKLYISLTISPIASPQSGEVVGAIGIFRDISEDRQEEKQRAEFISTASHEMRTPVAAIEGFLALALNPSVSKVDDKGREYLTKAHEATKHLGQLFQDLLTISKAEDGRLENHPQVIEATALLRDLFEQWRFAAEKKKLSLNLVSGDQSLKSDDSKVILPVYYVHADPERLREVLTNLFDNAVKYTAKGGITIRLEADNEMVMMSVEDTGVGIAREDIPHLFQKFYRVDNTATRQVGGTGLGLYLSRKIIELYQGNITLDSELGKGSRFTVSLPRISAEQAETARQSTLQAATNPSNTPNEVLAKQATTANNVAPNRAITKA